MINVSGGTGPWQESSLVELRLFDAKIMEIAEQINVNIFKVP